MITTFVSHSSAQQTYATTLVEKIGRNFCILDSFDFNPANKTDDEIYLKLKKSNIFVLLISREALKSPWVNFEIDKAKAMLEENESFLFLPYIIDEDVKIEDVPDWITIEKAYNLRLFKSPIMLAREIQQKRRKLLWEQNSLLRKKNNIFVGRNDKIEEFQNKLYSSLNSRKKVLITSGRDGVGKRKFVSKCVIEELHYDEEFEPFNISIDSKSNIEDFILQLNSISMKYTLTQLNNVFLGSVEGKVHLAVELLNDIYNSQGLIFIDDSMGIVRPDREVSDWFIDIITDPILINKLALFSFSKMSPSSYVEAEYEEIMHIQLLPLSTSDRRKIFYKYAQICEVEMNNNDAEYFIKKLLGSPSQLYVAVDTVKSKGIRMAKQDLTDIIEIGDKKVTALLNQYKDDSQKWNFLILLSNFEFISFEILQQIYQEDFIAIEKFINSLMVNSLIEIFGPYEMYLKLDYSIADYIQRSRMKLDRITQNLMEEVIAQQIIDSNNIEQDLSTYLYQIRHRLLKGETSQSVLLIPSIIIKSIIDLYTKNDWDTVICLCDKVLDSCNNFYEDVIHEIRYWLCLALCRKSDSRFYKEVRYFKGSDNEFLRGFYFRIEHNFTSAERCYRNVLNYNPRMNKVRRELVTVLLNQRKYNEALELAKENYENNPSNTYHITAYFRCLIRKVSINSDDKDLLNDLMKSIEKSFSSKKNSLLLSMKIEYAYMIAKEKVENVLHMIEDSLNRYPESYDLKRVANEYRYRQGLENKILYFEDESM